MRKCRDTERNKQRERDKKGERKSRETDNPLHFFTAASTWHQQVVVVVLTSTQYKAQQLKVNLMFLKSHLKPKLSFKSCFYSPGLSLIKIGK
jgi:hypothetical protein